MKNFWTIQAVNNNTAEILLYGYIKPDASASYFINELRRLEEKFQNINVRINSGGGDVFEGIAIFNAMQQSTANIETYVDGIAASMASIIALGGKKVHMSKNATMMIHQAQGGLRGTSDDLRNTADAIDGVNKIMASVYARKTGKTAAEVMAAWMNGKDNWLNADEAMAAKLVDAIYDGEAAALPAASMMDEMKAWQHYDLKFAAKFIQQNTNDNMKQFTLTPAISAALNISDAADAAAFEAAVTALKTEAAKVTGLTAQITALTAEKNKAEETKDAAVTELNTLKETVEANKIKSIAEAAVDAKKITVEMSTALQAKYKGDHDGLKTLLDAMQPAGSVIQAITGAGKDELAKLSAMTGDEIYNAGKMERLKELDMQTFKAKYKECFKADYAEPVKK
jgi:ATP-dependent Clp endopeptidase proteolytic subunit ClpP